MAIGWFTVLKSVPWSTVIANAPVVADGAKKLWKAVGNRNAPDLAERPADTVEQPSAGSDDRPLATRLADVRHTTERLEQQMLASSELIKTLAEQNAQLIERVEAQRVRTLWLTRGAVLSGLVTILALGLAIVGLMRA